MRRRLPAALLLALLLPAICQAQTTQIEAVLDRVFTPVRGLNLPACAGSAWSAAVDSVRKALSAPSNGWRAGANSACGLEIYVEQVPASGTPTGAAVYFVLNKDIGLSELPGLKGNHWRNIGDARFSRPIFSFASVERTMNTGDPNMPAGLRAVFGSGSRYGGLQQFSVPIGFQVFTHAALRGTIGNTLRDALNAPVDNLWMRAGFSSETVTDLVNREGARFIEIQLPPGTSLSGPLGATEARVTDATIYADEDKNVTAFGNMTFQSASPGKVFPAAIDLPATQAGSIDWNKSQMALSTPSVVTLEEFARVALALNAQVAGGGLVSTIVPTKPVLDKIAGMFKPLSTFKVSNPSPNADSFRIRAGSGFPDLKQFNLVILGSGATAKDDSGAKGPLLRLRGGMSVLGQQIGRTDTNLSRSGLATDSRANLTLNLNRVGLGSPGFEASAKIQIDEANQIVRVSGPLPALPDRRINFEFDPTHVSVSSPATCATPVEVSGRIALDRAPDVGAVLGALTALQPDPKKLVHCATTIYYLAQDGVVYVFDGSKQLMTMAADAFPSDQLAKFGTKGLKLVGGALVDAGNEAIDAGKKIGGAVGSAATKAAGATGGAIVDAGRETVRFAKNAFDREPSRPTYDCTNFRNPAFYNAYPPGRIWGARDEYTAGASSGAWARYVFSEQTQKFHPFGAKGALGATACGGLVGEKGVGLGRLNTADDEIWNVVLMCETIPPALKGPPVNTANECYAVRGLVTPRPALAGKMVQAQGDTSKTTLFVDQSGVGRRIGGGNDWRVWSECGLGASRYPATLLSLHDIHGITQARPIANAAECRAVMGSYWKPHPRTGQVVYYNDQYKNTLLITRDGKKRWLANKDNWNVYNACGLSGELTTSVSLAELADIPDGPPIGSGPECRAAIAEAGGRVPPIAPPPPPAPAIHPRAGQLVVYGDVYKNVNLVTRDGKKRWIGNKDKWSVFSACGLAERDLTYVTSAENNAIPNGAPIATGEECKSAIAEARRR